MNTLSRTISFIFINIVIMISLNPILVPNNAKAELGNCHSYTYWEITGRSQAIGFVTIGLYDKLNKDYLEVIYNKPEPNSKDDNLRPGDVVVFSPAIDSNGNITHAKHSGYVSKDGTLSHLRGSVCYTIRKKPNQYNSYIRPPTQDEIDNIGIKSWDKSGKKLDYSTKSNYISIDPDKLDCYPDEYIKNLTILQPSRFGLSEKAKRIIMDEVEEKAYPENTAVSKSDSNRKTIGRYWRDVPISQAIRVGGSDFKVYRHKKKFIKNISIKSIKPVELESDKGPLRITEGRNASFIATGIYGDGKTRDVTKDSHLSWSPDPLVKEGEVKNAQKGLYNIAAKYKAAKNVARIIQSNKIILVVEEEIQNVDFFIESVYPREADNGELFILPNEKAEFRAYVRRSSSSTVSNKTDQVKWNQIFINSNGVANPPDDKPYMIRASYEQDGKTITSNTINLRRIKPELRIEKTASHNRITTGGFVRFTIDVENTGNCDLHDVDINDSIPSELMIKSLSPDPGITCNTVNSPQLSCEIGTMAPGAVKKVVIGCEAVREGSNVINTVSASAVEPVRKTVHVVNASVNINISQNEPGQKHVVPEVEGKHIDTAGNEIRLVELSVGKIFEENHDEVPAGHVIRQYPRAGTHLNQYDPVDLDISRGKKERQSRTLFVDPPTRTIDVGDELQLEAYIWFDDRSEETVTTRARWTNAPGGLFTALSAGSFNVTAEFEGLTGSATINVRRPSPQSWDPAISDAEDVTANVPTPPADAYKWFVICNKKTGEVTYGKYPDPTRDDSIMSGPFSGPRAAQQWIEQYCPNWRCTTEGVCASSPAKGGEWKVLCGKNDLRITLGKYYDATRSILVEKGFLGEPDARKWVEQNYPTWACTKTGAHATGPQRGGPWGVYCNTMRGVVVVTKEPRVEHHKLQGNFHSLRDGQLWMNQNYPSGLCDNMGRYVSGWGDSNLLKIEDGQESKPDDSGWSMWDPEEDDEITVNDELREDSRESDDFAAPGSLAAKKAIKETDEEVRPFGEKWARNWNKLNQEAKQMQARQQAEADRFFQEGIAGTAEAIVSIATSNIKRKSGSSDQSSEPSYNIGPVGPNYNPVDGWGKPGQIFSGTITCPRSSAERAARCKKANEYAQKVNNLKESSQVWADNLARVNQFISQCCGNVSSSDDSWSDAGSGGMSRDDCINKYCPECAEAISFLGMSADTGCENCKTRNAAKIDQCVSGNGIGSGYGAPGMAAPKEYYVFRRYQTGQNTDLYTIGKISANTDARRQILYGPDTFKGCRAWLVQKGYWKE